MPENKDKDNDLPKDYFMVEKLLLRYLGFSFQRNKVKAYTKYFSVVFSLMVVYLVLVSLEFLKLKNDFDEFVNNLLFVFGYVVGLLRYAFLFLRRSKINAVMYSLQEGVFLPNSKRQSERETKEIKSCVNFTKKQITISFSLGICSALMCISMVYLSKKDGDNPKFPFGVFPTFDVPYNYQIALCYQMFVYSFIIVSYLLVDVLYANILVHVCVHCKNLQFRFRNLIKDSVNSPRTEQPHYQDYVQILIELLDNKRKQKQSWQCLEKKLRETVRYHFGVIDLVRNTEDVFNMITLITFVLITLFVCFIMYHASRLSIVNIDFWKDITILISATFYLVILSFWANKVMDESQAIANACYATNFVGSNLKFQKCLVLIIQRSQKPLTLTAGKFAKLSLVTMLGVFRASYSYFMFLRQANQELD